MPSSSLIKFLDLTTDDPKLKPVLDRLKEVVRVFGTKQIIDGQLLENISILPFGAGYVNVIPHKLGRMPNGFFIAKELPGANVGQHAASDESFLYLKATGTSTVSLWVF